MKIIFEKIDDNNNLYLKTKGGKGILLANFFVDDIIFGGKNALCNTFSDEMMKEFEISMFGEIKFFFCLTSVSNEVWYLYHSLQVCERNIENFWYGGVKIY